MPLPPHEAARALEDALRGIEVVGADLYDEAVGLGIDGDVEPVALEHVRVIGAWGRRPER